MFRNKGGEGRSENRLELKEGEREAFLALLNMRDLKMK